MKSIKFLATALTTLLVGMSFVTIGAQAAEEETQTGGFTIEGIPNDNQIDKNISYFYLHEEPSEEDTLDLKLVNSSNKDMILQVEVSDANTNSNGIIDYSGDLENHEALKTPLSTILKPENTEVKVPANSDVITKLHLKMPNKKENGVILGGINVSEKAEEITNKNQKKGTITVGNIYAYTLGVALTNDNVVNLYKNESVELDDVQAELFDGHRIVKATILNPHPYIFSEADVTGKVMKKGSQKVLEEKTKKDVSIAPQSAFPLNIDWGKKDLTPGTYVFKGTVTSGDKKWEFEKEFTIKAEEAKEINKESVFQVRTPKWLIWLSIVLVILTALGTIYLVIIKNKGE